MQTDHYVDIIARSSAQIAPAVLLSVLMQKLHPLIARGAQDSRHIAVAFPEMGERFGIGERMRLFAQHRATLEDVLDHLIRDPRFDDYWIARQIRQTPADRDRLVAFVRYRISHALSEERAARHPRAKTLNEINRKIRDKRMRHIAAAPIGMGYLDLSSASTGQQFRMFVQKISIEKGNAYGVPDGYGLSRPTQIVALPEFEL